MRHFLRWVRRLSAVADPQADWWRSAVIYQVYIRSFADGTGTGVGDIRGLRSRLDYLRDLGVDALWINPWYPSPMLDGGYDVADYRDIADEFGTLAEAEEFIAAAHARGLKVILDLVPNHTSDRHPWFTAALAAGSGSRERARYMFRPGRGTDGELPPNNWRSTFGGPAWTRVTERDGTSGEWYLHLFDSSQPDLDWGNDEVRDEFLDILRFWFDRGVDGMRIDVAHGMIKHQELPDLPIDSAGAVLVPAAVDDHPHWDRDGVHEIYRDWRRVADAYDPPRVFVAEAWVDSPERLAAYVRPGELHTAFNFDYLRAPWSAADLRKTIDRTLALFGDADAPATWVLSNHDVERHVTRYGRAQTAAGVGVDRPDDAGTTDEALGVRRARAAVLLMLALPGGAYVYQGEELGLPEVLDLPESALRDPIWERSGHTARGRDGCRVPLPWTAIGPSYGFGVGGAWLPQPADWGGRSAQAQKDDPASMLSLYREALRQRRDIAALGDGPLEWLADIGPDVLAFRRGPDFACVVNFGTSPAELPSHERVLLTSVALVDGLLPPDAAAWLTI
jgi:alpha-glucosidase